MNMAKEQFGPVALGGAPLGNMYSWVSDADADATLATALGHGIRLFDVAPLYGLGLAEQRLGRFLREHPAALRPPVAPGHATFTVMVALGADSPSPFVATAVTAADADPAL